MRFVFLLLPFAHALVLQPRLGHGCGCANRIGRARPPLALFGLGGRKRKAKGGSGSGSDITTVNHLEPVELALSGGQRRKLRDAGKHLKVVSVGDVSAQAVELQELVAADELVKVEFSAVAKKPEAVLLANELAAEAGAAVAEVVGNVALLYRPGKKRKYRI
jgi:RNA-binding protein YhbY